MTTGRLRRSSALLAVLAAAVALPGVAQAANPPATSVAQAIVADPTIVTGASYDAIPPNGSPVAVSSAPLGSFPTGGDSFAILSTGDAGLAYTPNNSGGTGADDGGPNVRGNTDFDVVVLRIELNVPAADNCLVGMDFRFLSDEYPEWVGSAYNDAFVAELDRSTWTTSGSTISAPDNFAFDPTGNPITINASGITSMTPENASGTTYDGATALLTAATPITPGHHVLYLSIFDQGDHVLDSAVFVDNLRFGRVADVTTDCKPGADLAKPHNVYSALGDSYSSGFGMGPFDKYSPSNDCQRSEAAYAPVLMTLLTKLSLEFHACQGAVTADFYNARAGGSWGELPQLDYLTDETGLVTFTIGGNDAHFADVLAECILGFELLPFNTCYNDDKVTKPVAESLARLDGQTATPTSIVPYDTLLRDVRAKTPYAARVQIGYPPFFTAGGSDRTWLPGGRCEGVKKADQRWMVEKVAEMNAIIQRNALRNGFVYVDPTSAFSGHELCSGGDEWFYGILAGGRFHPTAAGHFAIAQAIVNALDAAGKLEPLLVGPHETVVKVVNVDGSLHLLSIIIEWPGSDVELSLVSPSGKTYTRSAPNGAYHANGPTWEQFEIPTPEAGRWTVKLYGADVKPGGEPVQLKVDQEKPPNQRPIGRIALRYEGGNLVLDGSGSTDPDGSVVSWDWYLGDEDDDTVQVGQTVTVPATTKPQTVTLVVTDDEGLTDFVTVSTVAMDVKPGSDENPLNPKAQGEVPLALLSSPHFDATTIDASTLRVGPGGAQVSPPHVHSEDVNGDGIPDLMLQVENQEIGIAPGMTQVCATGTLPDGRDFQACDHVRVK